MRLLCNHKVMGAKVLHPREAWQVYETILAGGAVHFLEEPSNIQVHLHRLTLGAKASPDFWTDAYLAAFAQSAGMRLVTFDAGFALFKNLPILILR
jgi:predicted nucleic acid-binding protein